MIAAQVNGSEVSANAYDLCLMPYALCLMIAAQVNGSEVSANRREASNRFIEQTLEHFWLYTDPLA
jgi:hypothetical protein